MLRHLPAKLSAPEIAGQLCLSVNAVKTQMRHVYDKLGVYRRHRASSRLALCVAALVGDGLTRASAAGLPIPSKELGDLLVDAADSSSWQIPGATSVATRGRAGCSATIPRTLGPVLAGAARPKTRTVLLPTTCCQASPCWARSCQ